MKNLKKSVMDNTIKESKRNVEPSNSEIYKAEIMDTRIFISNLFEVKKYGVFTSYTKSKTKVNSKELTY